MHDLDANGLVSMVVKDRTMNNYDVTIIGFPLIFHSISTELNEINV